MKNDISVDQIVERVLLRSKPIYSTQHSSSIHSNLFNFQLQEENKQLKDRLQSLKNKYKKYLNQLQKQRNQEREIAEMTDRLERILRQNGSMQGEISRLRLKSQRIDKQSRINDMSQSKRTVSRQCNCPPKSPPQINRQPTSSAYICIQDFHAISQQESIMADVEIQCSLESDKTIDKQIQIKKKYIQSLRKIREGQQNIVKEYQRQVQKLKEKLDSRRQRNEKNESSSNKYQMYNGKGYNTDRSVPNAGSIIKVRRN